MTVDEYRRIALGMDGAIESAHMGHPDFRAHGRIFATIQTEERGGLMLTPEQQHTLLRDHPEMFVPESGAWGLQGATRVLFAQADEDVVGEAMTLAWQYSALRGAKRKAAPKNKGTTKKKAAGTKPMVSKKKAGAAKRASVAPRTLKKRSVAAKRRA
jgi:hypothetical protein